jgi:hypothetical protein
MQLGTQTVSVPKKMLWTGRVIITLPVLFLFLDGLVVSLERADKSEWPIRKKTRRCEKGKVLSTIGAAVSPLLPLHRV